MSRSVRIVAQKIKKTKKIKKCCKLTVHTSLNKQIGSIYQNLKILFIIISFTSLLLLWDSNAHNKLAVLYLTSFVPIFFKYVLIQPGNNDTSIA